MKMQIDADWLRAKNQEWQDRWDDLDDHYKNTDNARRFFISGFEQQSLDEWTRQHNKVCPYYDDGTKPESPAGAIGGRLSYQFTPTGLGTAITVKCACGEEENLTDYDSW